MQSTLFQVTRSLCQSHNRHVLYKTEWRDRFSKQQEILRRHGKIASFWKEMESGQQLQKSSCSCSSQLCSHVAVERLIWCCICLNNSKHGFKMFQTCLRNPKFSNLPHAKDLKIQSLPCRRYEFGLLIEVHCIPPVP